MEIPCNQMSMCFSLLLFFGRGPVIFVGFLEIHHRIQPTHQEALSRNIALGLSPPSLFECLITASPSPKLDPQREKRQNYQSRRTLLLPTFQFQLTLMFTKINHLLVFVRLPTAMVPRTSVSHLIIAKQGHKHNLFPAFSIRSVSRP